MVAHGNDFNFAEYLADDKETSHKRLYDGLLASIEKSYPVDVLAMMKCARQDLQLHCLTMLRKLAMALEYRYKSWYPSGFHFSAPGTTLKVSVQLDHSLGIIG